MGSWKPIETLKERKPCTDYVVADTAGTILLLWWVEEDREWLSEGDRDSRIAEEDIVFWYDIEPPPNRKT